eukprot:CAMPEP_0194295942 /NCGR_PEP_ID=MMETSP0169-20130528/54772_1 /TAXON_ID=218684 /ORGANISM="Corethron pennatum, Strain L29A3" /LENGTH=87 /DNA_ID=CAMNT_0039045249 /DNA_START=24 /DNA_END=284 /DNA_ORIENTATION=+
MGNEPSRSSRSGQRGKDGSIISKRCASNSSLEYRSSQEETVISDQEDVDEFCAAEACSAGQKRGAQERGEQLARDLAVPVNPPGVTT